MSRPKPKIATITVLQLIFTLELIFDEVTPVSLTAVNTCLRDFLDGLISTSHQLIRYFMSAFFRYIPFKNKSVAELCTYF